MMQRQEDTTNMTHSENQNINVKVYSAIFHIFGAFTPTKSEPLLIEPLLEKIILEITN